MRKIFTDWRYFVGLLIVSGIVMRLLVDFHTFIFWYPVFFTLMILVNQIFESYTIGVKQLDPLGENIKGWLIKINSFIVFALSIPVVAKILPGIIPDAVALILMEFDNLWVSGASIYAVALTIWDLFKGSKDNAIANVARARHEQAKKVYNIKGLEKRPSDDVLEWVNNAA